MERNESKGKTAETTTSGVVIRDPIGGAILRLIISVVIRSDLVWPWREKQARKKEQNLVHSKL